MISGGEVNRKKISDGGEVEMIEQFWSFDFDQLATFKE